MLIDKGPETVWTFSQKIVEYCFYAFVCRTSWACNMAIDSDELKNFHLYDINHSALKYNRNFVLHSSTAILNIGGNGIRQSIKTMMIMLI